MICRLVLRNINRGFEQKEEKKITLNGAWGDFLR